MRRASSVLLLLAAASFASAACHAQAPARDDDPSSAPSADMDAAPQPRSAFGRVIALMISSLQHPSSERNERSERAHARQAPVRTTAAGTPMGIEVGAAFRDALGGNDDANRGDASGRDATGDGLAPGKDIATRKRRSGHAPDAGTGGAAAATVPRAAPPEDPVLRQAALAGPD